MTKAHAEQFLINEFFATARGKKSAINHLSRKGVAILNERYPILDGLPHEIRIDNKEGILVLRPFKESKYDH